MNKKTRLVRIGIASASALLMAGACACVILSAMGIAASGFSVYLAAALTAALCALASWSGAMALVAAAGGALTLGIAVAANRAAFSALGLLVQLPANQSVAGMIPASSGTLLGALAAALLGVLFFALLSRPGGTPFVLLALFSIAIICFALNESASFGAFVPALIAALVAFSLSGEVQRDAHAWRAVIPAALVVAVALLLVPAGRLTWQPLEDAANSLRDTFEEYFHFTKERIAFSINSEGYDHAVETEAGVESRLGGPAYPQTDPVMQVVADGDVLLRGTIRGTYTGHSWVDATAKSRYLYNDFSRIRVRKRVLDIDRSDDAAFRRAEAQIEMLAKGTSTLFILGRVDRFSMPLSTAVYYNSVGEMFLSRDAEAGDAYSVSGWQPGADELMMQLVADARLKSDSEYADLLQTYTQLPSGIEEDVYALAVRLTQDASNPYEKALRIQRWLQGNCVYTLTPDYPDANRDFVSQFVLDTRAGYCSYFASAMAVMGRIAGLPTRYVEGYYVRGSGETPVEVTGEDAHAWVEIYFNGIGWISFNPVTGMGGDPGGESGDSQNDTADEARHTEGPGDTQTPPPEGAQSDQTPEPPDASTPEPEEPQDTPTPRPDDPQQTPSPEPDSGDYLDEPTPTPDLPPMGAPEDDPFHNSGEPDDRSEPNLRWLWILLLALLFLLAVALAVWLAYKRLLTNDPVRLSAQAQSAEQAAMILYRSILTLLSVTGQIPFNGESPAAFARRVSAQAKNPSFIAFASAVSANVYARAPVSKESLEAGQRAYTGFLKELRRSERIRYALRRLTRGLGDFEAIP